MNIRFFIIVIFLSTVSLLHGQNNSNPVNIIVKGEFEFIEPSVNALIYMEQLSFEEWKRFLTKLKYEGMDTENIPYIYSKGSFDGMPMVQGIAKDHKGVLIEWQNFGDKTLIMDSIEKELQPFFAENRDNQKFYLVKKENVTFQFILKRNSELGMESVHLKKL